MFELLKKYKTKGSFRYSPNDELESKCNAPIDQNGVYMVFNKTKKSKNLLYIGSSGQKNKDGSIKTRQSGLGGMKDRIVNGYHPKFGKIKRKHSWPNHMRKENIVAIEVNWWVTYEGINKDFPTDVEARLRDEYLIEFGKLPEWHKYWSFLKN
jgi:hypothetical protein